MIYRSFWLAIYSLHCLFIKPDWCHVARLNNSPPISNSAACYSRVNLWMIELKRAFFSSNFSAIVFRFYFSTGVHWGVGDGRLQFDFGRLLLSSCSVTAFTGSSWNNSSNFQTNANRNRNRERTEKAKRCWLIYFDVADGRRNK